MTKIPLKTIRMQRNHPRMFLPADDQDKDGFKLVVNVGPTFSSFGVVTLVLYFGSTFRLRITINIALNS